MGELWGVLCEDLGENWPRYWYVEYPFWVQNLVCILHFSSSLYIDGSVQDCSISSALAVELLQSCTQLSICDNSLW